MGMVDTVLLRQKPLPKGSLLPLCWHLCPVSSFEISAAMLCISHTGGHVGTHARACTDPLVSSGPVSCPNYVLAGCVVCSPIPERGALVCISLLLVLAAQCDVPVRPQQGGNLSGPSCESKAQGVRAWGRGTESEWPQGYRFTLRDVPACWGWRTGNRPEGSEHR